MPRGAGGMPSRIKLPRERLSLANSRSPCSTLISTLGWLSLAVEKTWPFCVGIVVLRSIRREDTTKSFDTQRERSHVEQEHIFDIAGQNACLDSSTDGHHFIRVHAAIWITIKDTPDQRLHGRHACLTANQHHLVDVSRTNPCIGERLHDRPT